jgi:peptidoglycan/LPS O-acetylase OafA/YrhL/lysophospholipase L1-like esterase
MATAFGGVQGRLLTDPSPAPGALGAESYNPVVGTAVEGRATAGSTESHEYPGAPTDVKTPPEPHLGRIPALDGIRALGIILVLFFHGGFSWAGGGFFGVDVFFVLSGFLITGLLVSEYRQNAGIGLARFWGHRIRRLVPALLVMLAGVALFGILAAPSDTLGQLRGDALATLLYVNNWHLVTGGQGYFAALNTPRPLLHTWSLSIEEQFYLVWPLVVLGVLRWTRSLQALLVLTVAGAGASAVAMAVVFGDGAGESRAYYGTDTRAQALLIGAALAIMLANPLPHRRSDLVTTTSLVRSIRLSTSAKVTLVVAGGIGLVAVVWMSVVDSSATAWIYRGGFTLVALATAGIIASVALVPDSPWARLLSLRPVRYVGAVSYGLYLFHWPIFVWVDHARTGLVGWPLFAVRIALSLAVAAASFHFLEMPVRRGVLRGWRGWVSAPIAVGGTAALVVAVTAGATTAVTAVPAVAALPAGSDPGASASVASGAAGSDGPIRVLLVGDSEASFLGFGLGPDSAAANVDFQGDGVFGCGLLTSTTLFHGTLVNGNLGQRGGHTFVPCATQLARWQADVQAFHPDVVLLAEGEYEVRDQRIGATWVHIGTSEVNRRELNAINGATRVLGSQGATVVLLTAPYYKQQEQSGGQAWPEDARARVDRYNALLRHVVAASNGKVVVADVNARLDPNGQFTTTVDGQVVRFADGIHVTEAGAKLISPWLLTKAAELGTAARAASTGSPPAPG